ncbi:MAG: AI-2E family transporter [Deltaproteobacteria bacterium]|nr:AI-2E family transporter [Deltaproteobacteria bacterium]
MEKNDYGLRFFILLLLLSLVLLLRLFWTYISAIVLALLLASVFSPLHSWLARVFKGRRSLASLVMTFLIMLILIVPVGGFIGSLSNEAFDFYQRTKNAVSVQKIQESINGHSLWAEQLRKWGKMTGVEFNKETIQAASASVGKKVGLFLYNQIRSVASNLINFLIHFFLMILTIYYVFKDGGRLKDYLIRLLPFPKEQLEKVVGKFQEMGKAIFVGNGLSGAIQGVLGGFGFYVFGLESPLLWGTIIAFMAFLPVIGASIIFIPASIILFLHGKSGIALGFLIYNLVYSSVIEYIIKPRVIGKEMQMNSLLVFIGIVGGIKLFGILGIIYGPLIITIFITMAEIYRLEYKENM